MSQKPKVFELEAEKMLKAPEKIVIPPKPFVTPDEVTQMERKKFDLGNFVANKVAAATGNKDLEQILVNNNGTVEVAAKKPNGYSLDTHIRTNVQQELSKSGEHYNFNDQRPVMVNLDIEGIGQKGVFIKQLGLGGDAQQNKLLRQDLAKAVATSIFNNAHDVSLTNMQVVKQDGKDRIVWNGTEKSFDDWIPQNSNTNRVREFFNNNSMGPYSAKNNFGTSKLNTYYQGIVPSHEMASALKEMSESKDWQKGLDSAKESISQLIIEYSKEPKNEKGLETIKDQLIEMDLKTQGIPPTPKDFVPDILNRSSNRDPYANKSPSELLEQAFGTVEKGYIRKQTEMKQVAEVMGLQADIDVVLKNEKAGKATDSKLLTSITERYAKIEKESPDQKVPWMKTGSSPIIGNLDGYMNARSKEIEQSAKANVQTTIFKKAAIVGKEMKRRRTTGGNKSNVKKKVKDQRKSMDL